jgi:hypothetical protein
MWLWLVLKVVLLFIPRQLSVQRDLCSSTFDDAIHMPPLGIVSALASSDSKRARHIADRLDAVLGASPLSLPPALECTCRRTIGCAHRRVGDHLKASRCFEAALALPDGEDEFQRINTLMLLSNSMSSLQRCAFIFYVFNLCFIDSRSLDHALESASQAQALLQKLLFEKPHLMAVTSASDSFSAPVQMA